MTVTLSVGWWLLPLGITIGAFGAYAVWEARQPPPTGWGDAAGGIVSLLAVGVAAIVSLVAWLIWALLR